MPCVCTPLRCEMECEPCGGPARHTGCKAATVTVENDTIGMRAERVRPAPPEERCGTCGNLRSHWAHDVIVAKHDYHTFTAPLADGGECRHGLLHDCPDCDANEIAALRARVAELERVIEWAPHTFDCEWRTDEEAPCDCWKSKAKVSG